MINGGCLVLFGVLFLVQRTEVNLRSKSIDVEGGLSYQTTLLGHQNEEKVQ